MPARDKNLWSGASKAQWFANRYPGSIMPHPNTVVLHTTEGTGWPSYSGGAVAPNFTCKADFKRERLVWHQHFPANMSARALENHSGGVETNTLNVIQVEIVGTCDPSTHRKWGSTPHLYTEDLPDWAIRDLGHWLAWVHATYPVPLTSDVTWTAYPQSYGSGGQRMSQSKWLNFNGVCGHEHVPENVHGDPGAFPIKKLLAAAGGSTLADTSTPIAPQEDTLPSVRDVWTTDGIIAAPNKKGKNKFWLPASYLRETFLLVKKIANAVGDSIPAPDRFPGKDNPTWTMASYLRLTYAQAYKGRVAAEAAQAIAEKQAEKGSALTAAEIDAIKKAVAEAAEKGVYDAVSDVASGDAEVTVKIGDKNA